MALTGKIRIDLLLVDRGLVQSRERARALILAGRVLVNEQKIDKPGTNVSSDAAIRLLGDDMPYVSRGGLKLQAALDHWQIDIAGRACLDVGASTGGFTDCLLQRGGAHVTAVDTGFGQIAMKLRNDPRVHLVERTNARFLAPGALAEPGQPVLTLLVMHAQERLAIANEGHHDVKHLCWAIDLAHLGDWIGGKQLPVVRTPRYRLVFIAGKSAKEDPRLRIHDVDVIFRRGVHVCRVKGCA